MRDWTNEFRRALKADDLAQLRALLRELTRLNIGEAYYPGLKKAAGQARRRLALDEG